MKRHTTQNIYEASHAVLKIKTCNCYSQISIFPPHQSSELGLYSQTLRWSDKEFRVTTMI